MRHYVVNLLISGNALYGSYIRHYLYRVQKAPDEMLPVNVTRARTGSGVYFRDHAPYKGARFWHSSQNVRCARRRGKRGGWRGVGQSMIDP